MTARSVRRAACVSVLAGTAIAALASCAPAGAPWFASSTAPGAATAARPVASANVTTLPPPVSRTVAPPATASAVHCSGDGSTTPTAPTATYATLGDRSDFTAAVSSAWGRWVAVGAGTLRFDDFRAADGTVDGGVLGPAASGLIGAGASRSVLEVAPHTSTHAGDVPTTFPQTNQLDVLRVSGTATVLRDFTVQGTAQGHLYNGLRVARVAGLRASGLRVVGIPGNDGKPPGETFGINDYRTTGSRWSHIDVDGAGVGASGFGVNGSSDIRICDTTSEDNRYGMGFAVWQSSGVTLVDCKALGNGFSGFNFERMTGTTTLIRPVALENKYGMRIASDRSSARFRIVDPQLTDGTWTVTLPKEFYGVANRQRRSDITLIIDGKSRPDLLRFQTY